MDKIYMEEEMAQRDELFHRFYEIQKAIDRAELNGEPTENLKQQKEELIAKIESN